MPLSLNSTRKSTHHEGRRGKANIEGDLEKCRSTRTSKVECAYGAKRYPAPLLVMEIILGCIEARLEIWGNYFRLSFLKIKTN